MNKCLSIIEVAVLDYGIEFEVFSPPHKFSGLSSLCHVKTYAYFSKSFSLALQFKHEFPCSSTPLHHRPSVKLTSWKKWKAN